MVLVFITMLMEMCMWVLQLIYISSFKVNTNNKG